MSVNRHQEILTEQISRPKPINFKDGIQPHQASHGNDSLAHPLHTSAGISAVQGKQDYIHSNKRQ